MAQQINLLTPILLAPRRHFSAVAMLQGLILLLGGGLIISVYLIWQAKQTSASLATAHLQARNERQSLQQAMMALPGGGDSSALKQQLAQLKEDNNKQAQALSDWQSGLSQPGRSHADLLRLLARTTPAAIWLQELRWSGHRLQMDGRTLDPAGLQPWLARLAEHPLLQGQQLAAVRVERQDSTPSGALRFGDENAMTAPPGKAPPVWGFRVVSAVQAPAAAASAASAAGVQP